MAGSNQHRRPPNSLSARLNPQVVRAAIAVEVAAGRVVDLGTVCPPDLWLTPLGLAPKDKDPVTGEPISWRLIENFSHEESINSAMAPEDWSVRYETVSDLVDVALRVRDAAPGAPLYLLKFDISAAYRQLILEPGQQRFAGFAFDPAGDGVVPGEHDERGG